MKFNSVRLIVADFDDCFRFYRDVLGFTPDWGELGSTYANFRVDDGTSIALFRRELMAKAVGTDNMPSTAPSQDRVALVFLVEELDRLVEQLRTRGIEFVSAPRDYPDWGIRAAHLRDPDGNLLELCMTLPHSTWSTRTAAEADRYQAMYAASGEDNEMSTNRQRV